MTKFCIICGKPLTGAERKVCSNEECHKERKREYSRKFRQENPEKIKETNRRYRQEHKDEGNKSSRDYARKHPERMRKSYLKYRQNNPEKIKENCRRYRQNNPEKVSRRNRKNYRKARGLPEDCDLYKESSIEIMMREWLQNINVGFEQEFKIILENLTWTCVDFYIPKENLCLYLDGEYWHSLPGRQARDMKITDELKRMGYKVIRIPETEMLKNDKIWSELMQYLGVNGNGKKNYAG